MTGKYKELCDSIIDKGVLKMRRLDDILKRLGETNDDLMFFNKEFNLYNYKLKLSLCDQLYDELASKSTQTEREELLSLRRSIGIRLKNNSLWLNFFFAFHCNTPPFKSLKLNIF